jgi:uncharacterized heparinase superfamily protein
MTPANTTLPARSAFAARGSMRWLVNRARAMTAAEMLHHLVRILLRLDTLRPTAATALPAPDLSQLADRCAWIAGPSHICRTRVGDYVRAANSIIDGHFVLLDGRSRQLGFPPSWQINPVDCDRDRAASPGVDDTAPPDIRFHIELHRHGELIRLAQAWALTREQKFFRACVSYLSGWWVNDAAPPGPAWSSTLEAALRLINWSLAWQLLGLQQRGERPEVEAFRIEWLAHIYRHAKFVSANLSRFSSANNHLIGELAALCIARRTWPCWPQLHRWGAHARIELEREAIKQIAPDGSSREQASWYQRFVFDLLLLAWRAEADEQPFCHRLRERLVASARFIDALRDRSGHLLAFGDEDSARLIGLDPKSPDPWDEMNELVDAINTDAAIGAQTHVSDAPVWLFGTASRSAAPNRAANAHPRRFDEGGLYLLGRRGQREALMSVDCGPLGYLGIAAHGHADALAVQLSVAGYPVLVDRGTYVYNADPVAREFFRSTAAHNTVTVDGRSQSEPGGSFLWLDKARARLRDFRSDDAEGVFAGEHDGYRRLPDPVLHRRDIAWSGSGDRFTITDTLIGQKQHSVCIAWHFAPSCEVALHEEGARVITAGAVLLFSVRIAGARSQRVAFRWALHRGQTNALHGWHSGRFGRREPAASLLLHTDLAGTAQAITDIAIDYKGE